MFQRDSTLGAIASLWILGTAIAAEAVQLSNGKVFFDQVPRLEQASTTLNNTHSAGAIYTFQVQLPSDAGEPLKHLEIQQKEGVDRVDFNLQRTRAFLNSRRGSEVAIESVERRADKTVRVSFQEAIAPGNTVFLALRPYWNPDTGGVYLFGVTALPEGETVHPQFLGYGRLHFYERDGFFGHRRYPWGWSRSFPRW